MNLINKLPSFYENGVCESIQNSFSVEANNINNSVEDTLNQFFVNTATYGLDKWETMLSIPKNKFNYQTRRENIKAKLRSRGVTTIDTIKRICEAYSNGQVEIIVDHKNYSFVIKFVGDVGIPQAFEELDKTIEDIKPCHLAHSYEFAFNNHADISKFTHEELSKFTHEEIRSSKLLERGDVNA